MTWSTLDVPEGWRPEITPEGIVISPPPTGEQALIAERVHQVLRDEADTSLGVFQTLGVGVPSVGGVFIPDVCVVPRAEVPRGADPVLAQHVLLAVEITSRGTADRDRTQKKWAYAHGTIPQFLLIDAFDEDGPAMSLFSNPVSGVYQNAVRVAFGQVITLGEPLKADLDSALFD